VVAKHLEEIFHIIADSKGVEILSLEIMPDHIHLFVSSPPQHSPSLLINWFKGISSRMYNYWYNETHIKWTNSYYVGTAGTVTAETIKKYIEEQKSK
jgi:putative transposase